MVPSPAGMDDERSDGATAGGAPLTSATVLFNASARKAGWPSRASRIARYLDARGVSTEVVIPDSAEAATRAARLSAQRGDDALFVVGGDGSLRDAATGLAHTHTALAAVRGGTVNIWAREAGIPAGLRTALVAHLSGLTVAMDLGLAGERHFLLMASVGWDAAITATVSSRLKHRIGDLAYVVRALQMAPRLRPAGALWRSGLASQEARLAVLVLSNTRLYGGRVRVSPVALADDGLLDVAALMPRSALDWPSLAVRLLTGALAAHRRAIVTQVDDLSFETPGLPFQLDGDYAGRTPVRFGVDHLALRVRVPAGPLPPIFSTPAVPRM